MEYNPFVARYRALMNKISSAEEEKKIQINKLTWYDSFNGEAKFSALSIALREVNLLKLELEEICNQLTGLNLRLESLNKAVSLGWNPSYWFSTERFAKQNELSEHRQLQPRLILQRDTLQKQICTKEEQITVQQADIKRYRSFDRLEAEATVKALNSHLLPLIDEFKKVKILKERVDEKLREPLAELKKAQWKRDWLESEINRAIAFDKQLKNASNGYERKIIHEECSASLGEGNPARVINDSRKELDGVNRTIKKLEDRAKSISQRADRIINTLVIDGNNMCYQHQSFIGLSALQAVAKKLSRDYPVVVIVFDGIIRRQLQMSDRDIAAKFDDVIRVHVVASKQKADETLLDAARDLYTYVISNDRFKDFPEKQAVRDRRLITHEILNNKVFVHDLDVAEDWV